MNNVDLTTLLIYTVMFFSFCTAKQKRTKRKSSSLKTLRAALTLKLQRARVALLVDDGLVWTRALAKPSNMQTSFFPPSTAMLTDRFNATYRGWHRVFNQFSE